MNFRAGEKVKAFVKLGLQKEQSWQIVNYNNRLSDVKHLIEHGGKVYCVNSDEIRRWVPIKTEEIELFGKSKANDLFAFIKDASNKLGLNHLLGEITLQEEDSIINLCGGRITVQPGSYDQKCIGKIREMACWTVSAWRTIPATHLDPEDVAESHIGHSTSNSGAAKLAIMTTLKFNVDDCFEAWDEMHHADLLGEDW